MYRYGEGASRVATATVRGALAVIAPRPFTIDRARIRIAHVVLHFAVRDTAFSPTILCRNADAEAVLARAASASGGACAVRVPVAFAVDWTRVRVAHVGQQISMICAALGAPVLRLHIHHELSVVRATATRCTAHSGTVKPNATTVYRNVGSKFHLATGAYKTRCASAAVAVNPTRAGTTILARVGAALVDVGLAITVRVTGGTGAGVVGHILRQFTGATILTRQSFACVYLALVLAATSG